MYTLIYGEQMSGGTAGALAHMTSVYATLRAADLWMAAH